MYAAEYGHLSVVEHLLERGADMEARDNVRHANTPRANKHLTPAS